MNRSAKVGSGRSRTMGAKASLIHPSHQGVCWRHDTEDSCVKAVNQLPRSVVREIRTPRSVGAGAGDRLRRSGGREVTRVPTAKVTGRLPNRRF
jgi:hypothetical protein